jgi:hypothetical protein
MTTLQFKGKLTDMDLNEVGRMTRSKMYWVKFFVANWYGCALIAIVIWATISGLLGQIKPNWRAVALLWLIVVAMVSWVVYRTKRSRAKQLARLNATLPDYISLTTDGVKLDGPDGATSLLPWRNFKGWREGKQVILIEQNGEHRFVMLPLGESSESDRQSVRQFLQSNISQTS